MKFIRTLGLVITGLTISFHLSATDANSRSADGFSKKFDTNSLEAIRDFSASLNHPVEALPVIFRMEASRALPKEFTSYDKDKNQIITTQEMKVVIQEYNSGKSPHKSDALCQLIDFFFNQYK